MSIVLLEASNSGQAGQCARELIAMNNTKIGHAPRKVFVGDDRMGENDTVTRAVHRLQSEHLFLNVEREHSILVVFPMPRSFPKLRLVNVRRHHLLIISLSILGLEEVL